MPLTGSDFVSIVSPTLARDTRKRPSTHNQLGQTLSSLPTSLCTSGGLAALSQRPKVTKLHPQKRARQVCEQHSIRRIWHTRSMNLDPTNQSPTTLRLVRMGKQNASPTSTVFGQSDVDFISHMNPFHCAPGLCHHARTVVANLVRKPGFVISLFSSHIKRALLTRPSRPISECQMPFSHQWG